MIIAVNGEQIALGPGATVKTVVELLAVGAAGVAVAVNGEVVPRSAWESTQLGANDRVEVLSAAQGG